MMIVIAYVIYVFINQSTISTSAVNGYLVLEQQFRRNNAGLQLANSIIYESLETVQDTSEAELIASIRELANKESEKAIELQANEILRINQQQELQNIQFQTAQSELRQRNTLLAVAFTGIAFVMVLLIISTGPISGSKRTIRSWKNKKKKSRVSETWSRSKRS